MRHALVTGAAGAIGAALARVLRARDARLALSLADVDPRIDAIAAELSGRALRWDLAQPDALDTRLGELVEASGPVDLLVNCAGVMDVRGIG
ncbi:MAG: SDR family NAD(P)-dependent oxidoreductase, partial [Sandaracinaceae bacterium]|nr:SDR family NAD(P)-dependent oxidoreductase [Sandaracinaceae bacterium]